MLFIYLLSEAQLLTYSWMANNVKDQRFGLFVLSHNNGFQGNGNIFTIIQQIRAMPIYGQKVIVIRHPYVTDILRCT